MALIKGWVGIDCTACGLCADICPGAFVIKDIATVIEVVKYTE